MDGEKSPRKSKLEQKKKEVKLDIDQDDESGAPSKGKHINLILNHLFTTCISYHLIIISYI